MDAIVLMDAIPAPMVLIGSDHRIVAANRPAEQVFGRLIQGRHYITAMRQPALLDCSEGALESQVSRTVRFPDRDSLRDTTYCATASPLAGQAGILLFLEDLSLVEEASKMRRDFVANVSHELRSPLTALLGFIETVRGPARDDQAARERFLEIMEREAERMNRLVQDLLSLSRVEAEERRPPTGQVDVAELVTSAVETLEPQAREREVAIGASGANNPLYVHGNPDQLLQVLTNLIENAVKYGGGIVRAEISLNECDPELQGPAVRISVHDNGDGIDPVHIPRLTERFYRIDTHRSREIGGTGLGLAIVKHILNRHQGRLRIRSEAGKGSCFTVILPRHGAESGRKSRAGP